MGGYLLAGIGLCLYFRKARRLAETEIGVAVLAGILFVPYLHYHDLAILLIPLFCMLRVLRADGRVAAQDIVLLPLAASYLLLVGFMGFWIRYPVVYLLMLAIGGTLIAPGWIQRLKPTRPAGSERP